MLYRREHATASEVMADLPDAPTYSAARGLLRIMVDRNLITFESDGTRHVYAPAQRRPAALSALRQVVQTFFGGSAEQAVMTLLSAEETRLSDDELARLSRLIEQAQSQGAFVTGRRAFDASRTSPPPQPPCLPT